MRQPQPPHPAFARRHGERPLLEVVEEVAGRPAPRALTLLLGAVDEGRTLPPTHGARSTTKSDR